MCLYKDSNQVKLLNEVIKCLVNVYLENKWQHMNTDIWLIVSKTLLFSGFKWCAFLRAHLFHWQAESREERKMKRSVKDELEGGAEEEIPGGRLSASWDFNKVQRGPPAAVQREAAAAVFVRMQVGGSFWTWTFQHKMNSHGCMGLCVCVWI